jgi:predicted Ser/Thr protein kinase
MKERSPKKLGRYEIRRELGRGTMGVVYEAQDPMLHRRIALKAIRLAVSVPADVREHFEKRFLAEARAVAVLSHPGIVVVHDVGSDEKTDTPYIAMEFLEGRTLEEEAAGGEPQPWREALDITGRAAWALQHAHERGIVHRDIKPANIMRLPSGQPKIMDFGIARLPASELTAAGDLFGTPAYMSPEQASGEVAEARSDIFSLGCVLYQLVSGRKAFDADSLPLILLRVREEIPAPPSRWVEGLPPEVDTVVARSMAKSPGERYPDARSFAEDIEDVLAGRPPRHTEILPELGGDSTMVSRPVAPVATSASGVPAATHARAKNVAPPARDRKTLGLFVGAVSLVAAGFLAALTIPWRGQPVIPLPTLAPVIPPAKLELAVEHPLSRGTVRVWIDGDQVLEEDLRGRVAHKVLSLRTYKGTFTETLDVAPGEHVVRVHVEGEDFSDSLRIRGTFESRVTRRLVAKVGGLLTKKLSLVWGSPSRE